MTKPILSQRIETLRENKGLLQAELAHLANIEPSYVSKLESGQAPNVSGVILARIARALDTSTDYLLGLTDMAARPATADELSAVERAASDERLLYLATHWHELPEKLRDGPYNFIRLWLETHPPENEQSFTKPPTFLTNF